VSHYGGIYATHIRGESDTLIKAVEEAIFIGEEAGIAVQISHYKAVGRENWGRVEDTLRLIDAARARGVDVTVDQYPYVAGSGPLSSVLPDWAHEGGVDGLMRRLSDPASRARMKRDIKVGISGWWNPVKAIGWDNIVISQVATDKNRMYEGRSIAQIAGELGLDPFEVLFNLLYEEQCAVRALFFQSCEKDVISILTHSVTMIGSDGFALPVTESLVPGKPHPRSFGTFPRVLGRYVRSERVLTLEEAVHKMTLMPAEKLGLKGRGRIEEGAVADITVFDPRRVCDCATFDAPVRAPVGIVHVLVGGRLVVRDGVLTGERPGKVIRKGRPER
jgi:N-acyl-D-amino-acid deacylase